MVWVIDSDGHASYLNSHWHEYTGLPTERGLGHGWEEAVHPDDLGGCLNLWNEAVRRRTSYEAHLRYRRADGSYRWFLSRALPVTDADGRILQWFGTSTDIEDQKRNEERLREADRQKDEFLATLAHELRNPLAPISDAVQILGALGTDSLPLQEIQQLLAGQVEQLQHLVEELSDLSRVRRGAIDLRRERTCVTQVVRHALETSAPHVRAGRHQLSVTDTPDPVFVIGDPVRRSHVISNLLTNAAKYTPAGGRIWLTVEREGTEAFVRVRDNGEGIPTDFLPRVFDVFVQEDRL